LLVEEVHMASTSIEGGAAAPAAPRLPTHNKEETEFLTGARMSDVTHNFFFAGRPDITEEARARWRLLLTDTEIQLTVRWLAAEINRRFIGEQIVITGILKGVFMFMADLCKHITIPHTTYFVEASSYQGTVQGDKVQFLSKLVSSKFEGRKVVLLDELYDNGKTLNSVKDELCSQLGKPADEVFTCTLFAKNKHTAWPNPDLVGFDAFPDVWLVGYGLDDGGEKRGWPHVFGVPKPDGEEFEKCEADKIFDGTDEGEEVFRTLRSAFRQKLGHVAESF
jgi:hypoxanthine phosphoribosyltransferase